MKVVSVVGARPQFIKSAPLGKALRAAGHLEFLIHTGQHYDYEMSQIFFAELGINAPDANLEIGSGSHGWQTAQMLLGIEEVLLAEKPDQVLVYGDTNSTLAGALAAAKLGIPVILLEAGLRSFNRAMPEEINRIIVDHLAKLLLCPSQAAVNNLTAEGIAEGVYLVGDVMADALAFALKRTGRDSSLLKRLGLTESEYLLATVHRAENTDDEARLSNILTALARVNEPVVFPVHPRTRQRIAELDLPFDMSSKKCALHLIEPLGYLEMVRLEQSARMILTDSGGVQKEAYWLGVPCLTLRDETEWIETVETGWNVLVGSDTECILSAVNSFVSPDEHPLLYGDGHAAERCVALMEKLSH